MPDGEARRGRKKKERVIGNKGVGQREWLGHLGSHEFAIRMGAWRGLPACQPAPRDSGLGRALPSLGGGSRLAEGGNDCRTQGRAPYPEDGIARAGLFQGSGERGRSKDESQQASRVAVAWGIEA